MFFTKAQGLILSFLTMVLGVLLAFYFLPAETWQTQTNPAKVVSSAPFEEKPPVEKIKNKEPFIIALLGTDQRGEEAARTDTIMLVRYDMENKQATILSIPRDTLVTLTGYHQDKINAAHVYGGVPLTLSTIEDTLDIDIDYYAKVNFEGFKEAMAVFGGLEVDVQKEMKYENVHLKPGTQVLKGDDLLMYVRFRKDEDGDFGRIKRQQEVIKKVAGQMILPSNLIKLPQYMSIFAEHVETDLNLKEMASLAMATKEFSSIKVDSHTLKTTSQKVEGIWYELIDDSDLESKSKLLNEGPEDDFTKNATFGTENTGSSN